MILIVLLAVVLLTAPLFFRLRETTVTNSIYLKNYETRNLNTKIYYFVICAFIVAVIGFRDSSIGIDTEMYRSLFSRYQSVTFSEAIHMAHTEYGYVVLNWLIGKSSGQFQIFLVVCAVLYVVSAATVIYQYSAVPWMSFYLFITFGFMTFGMSTMRQTVALTFTMIAFCFIRRRKLFWYLFFLALAVSFHQTALIFLPAYWLGKFKINRKFLLLTFAAFAAVVVFKDKLLAFAQNYARIQYKTQNDAGGWLTFTFVALSVLLGIILKKQFLAEDEGNQALFYMMFAVLVIFPIAQTSPVLFRLYYYYSIFLILYVPNLLHSIKDPTAKMLGYIGYMVSGAIELTLLYNPTLKIIPYRFFWS